MISSVKCDVIECALKHLILAYMMVINLKSGITVSQEKNHATQHQSTKVKMVKHLHQ